MERVKLEVWHNLAWSRYKAGVFSALASLATGRGDSVHITQIALTDSQRAALSDTRTEQIPYPHEILYHSHYDEIPRLQLYRDVARRAWQTEADITFIAGVDRPEYWIQAVILALRGRKRAVFFDSTRLDKPPSLMRRLAKRLFFSLVPWTLSYGERARANAISHGVSPNRALLRPQAAYLPPDYNLREIPRLRQERRDPAKWKVLYVGRLSPEKRVDVLIEGFAEHHASYPAANLRIVGAGPEEKRLRHLAQASGAGDALHFVGSLQDDALVEEYLGADVLVLPSHSEPWGLVVNEALHYGCPVIVSDRCGCVPELVEGTRCGLVIPSGDPVAVSRALALAQTRFADRETVAQACLATIGPYSAEAAARKIIDAADLITGASS